jgi:hypothetical protein
MTPASTKGATCEDSMTTPKRLQLSRTKGWRKPEGAISVARPHKWGNPYKVGTPGVPNREKAVRLYRQWLPTSAIASQLPELTGHDLACWCPTDQACHADLLLELANQ